MESLSHAKEGETCTIKWMLGSQQAMDYIRGFQIGEGSCIRVLKQLLGSTVIAAGDVRLVLGHEVADRIKV